MHMPTINSSLIADYTPVTSRPETIKLFLPSQCPHQPPLSTLREKETRLRLAQAEDALHELKRLLRIIDGLWQHKFTQIGFGQGPNTRLRSQITRFKAKVSRTADRYRMARAALLELDPQGTWISQLKPLNATDLRGPLKQDENRAQPQNSARAEREPEGYRQVSWIWLTRRSLAEANEEGAEPLTESEITEGTS